MESNFHADTTIEGPLNSFGSSMDLLREVCEKRFQVFFSQTEEVLLLGAEPEYDGSSLGNFVYQHGIKIEAHLIILIALAPHIQPTFFDSLVQSYLPNGGEFPEFGGVKGSNHRGMLPTGETALFILAGNDLEKRMEVSRYFSPDHFFSLENILTLETVKEGEPRMSGRIILRPEYVDLFTTGAVSKPSFGPDFPAKQITTQMTWDDLVLNPKTGQQIHDIKTWLDHNATFLGQWGMARKIKPGFRALFYGPPGTGKTLTATLLGKQFSKDVYRIDLSQVVSKYIGETEKNLEKIFQKAEHKNWILFFDEADSLFGKRSNVQSAHDKYANQETSYLLQRVEDFPGLVILASNYKNNIDQAFVRRFNAIVHFPAPNASEREKIWRKSIPPQASVAEDVDLCAISNQYDLTGSSIINVVHHASLQAISKNIRILSKRDLLEGIKREFEKEDKVFL